MSYKDLLEISSQLLRLSLDELWGDERDEKYPPCRCDERQGGFPLLCIYSLMLSIPE